ncbi:RNA recognition motif-containing protein [Achlya hypogyna]|uniref:RNA recognition motif-containing protein n=1 Tax=Achlya hypogyna TaxID=1202772 RepID=A0A1V9ZTF2_ACHHY|nr:RNA recognition motif-containing protein [Achlya hypogyna]
MLQGAVVIQVTNVPGALATQAIEELLAHVGATETRILAGRGKKKSALAAFPNESIGAAAITRLNKMRLADHQLAARIYQGETETTMPRPIFPPLPPEPATAAPCRRQPTPIAPHLGLHYPPSPLLAYKYPKASPEIVANIANALMALPKLYTQVLHLMNKMNLPPPFEKDIIKGPFSPDDTRSTSKRKVAETFQASDDEDDADEEALVVASPLPKPLAPAPPLPHAKRQKIPKPPKKLPGVAAVFADDEASTRLVSRPGVISEAELIRTRLSPEALAATKYMKGYTRGEPSTVLYVKNIAKGVDASDLRHVFGAVFPDDESMIDLSIKLFTEGRLKGQAFVEFPTQQLATLALEMVHGVTLEDKPLIVVGHRWRQAMDG